jgi:hypothetical protein
MMPPFVAITSPSGYGYSASAMISSLVPGPYASAVSMKSTPSAMARFNTSRASAGSFDSPQMPSPVTRCAEPEPAHGRSLPIVSVPERVRRPVPMLRRGARIGREDRAHRARRQSRQHGAGCGEHDAARIFLFAHESFSVGLLTRSLRDLT